MSDSQIELCGFELWVDGDTKCIGTIWVMDRAEAEEIAKRLGAELEPSCCGVLVPPPADKR